jgi:hypothetical protein
MAERKPSEYLPIIATVDPQVATTQTLNSDAFDMQKYRAVMAIVQAGTFVTAGTIDATMSAGATSTGAWTTITGTGITQLTEVGSDDNKQVVINLTQADVSSTAKRWARLNLTIGGSSGPGSAVVLGIRGRFAEAFTTISYGDLSSVDEIVN